MRTTIVVVLMLMGSCSAWGTTFYVSKGASGNCSSASTGGTHLGTIRAGIDCLNRGDTVIIHGGEYPEWLHWYETGLRIPSGFSLDNPTTIKGADGETVVINPSNGGRNPFDLFYHRDANNLLFENITFDGSNIVNGNGQIFSFENGSPTRWKNCVFKNYNQNGSDGNLLEFGGTYNEVLDSEFIGSKTGYGIYTSEDHNLIEGNYFHDTGAYGVHLFNGFSQLLTHNNTVRNNLFVRCGQVTHTPAIVVPATDNYIYNNVLVDNAGDGISIYTGSITRRHKIYHNTVVRSAGVGIYITDNATQNEVVNNIVYQNAIGTQDNGSNNNIMNNTDNNDDPRFVNCGVPTKWFPSGSPYCLAENSPARNVGIVLAGYETDAQGNSRGPAGAPTDAGAYVFGGEPPPPPGNTLYVADSGGSDNNDGSSGAPFKTIQKCASVVTAGGTCLIRTGTYRETITPTNSGSAGSPITFKPDGAAVVTINGTDVVTGWTAVGGSIYQHTPALPWNLDPSGNNSDALNQAFVDGTPLIVARWPNTTQDLTHPVWARATGGQSVGSGGPGKYYLYDLFPFAANFWTGGGKLITHGADGYYGEAWDVTAQSGNRIDFNAYVRVGETGTDLTGEEFFLIGKSGALDAPGEWWMDGSGVRVRTWDSSNPSGHTVEVKRRVSSFDLSNRSYITVQGVKLFATGLKTNDNSHHIVLDGLEATYTSSFVGGGWFHFGGETGIVLAGDQNTLKNSNIGPTAGSAVWLTGSNHTVTNNTLHDFNYAPSGVGGVQAMETPGGHTITYNTMYNAGRAAIEHGASPGLTITHNLFYNLVLQSQDTGATYAYETDGGNTTIAYNILRDSTPTRYSSNFLFGFYLDSGGQPNSNFLLHHNLIYNLGGDSAAILTKETSNVQIYNTTSWNTVYSLSSQGGSLPSYNNLVSACAGAGGCVEGTDLQNNRTATSTDFVDAPAGNFELTATSLAVNNGRVITGITTDAVGAPDVGARERGATPWVAGASTVVIPPSGPQTYYMAPAASGGTDANSCDAAREVVPGVPVSTPKEHFASVLACMHPGDTLFLRAGIYTDTLRSSLTPIPGGTDDATRTRIAAYESAPGVFESVTLRSSTGDAMVWLNASATDHFITFDHLNLDGQTTTGNGLVLYPGVHHITWNGGDIKSTIFEGIYIQGANTLTISNTAVHDTTFAGTAAVGITGTSTIALHHLDVYNAAGLGAMWIDTSTGVTVEQSRFRNTAGRGLLIAGSTVAVQNSLIYTNTLRGIEVQTGSANVTLYYNTLWNNMGAPIQIDAGATTTTYRGNILTANGNGNAVSNAGTGTVGTNNFSGDPNFVSPGPPTTFHVQGASVVGQGPTIGSVSVDFAGQGRTVPYTMGAYEDDAVAGPPPTVVRVPPYGTTGFFQVQ